jgi:hypothetical protein
MLRDRHGRHFRHAHGHRESAQLRATMLAVGRREMRTHPRGRLVAAAGSSHFIAAQQPELAATEIRRVVHAVRAEAAPTVPA